jgi:hypothetical protein
LGEGEGADVGEGVGDDGEGWLGEHAGTQKSQAIAQVDRHRAVRCAGRPKPGLVPPQRSTDGTPRAWIPRSKRFPGRLRA